MILKMGKNLKSFMDIQIMPFRISWGVKVLKRLDPMSAEQETTLTPSKEKVVKQFVLKNLMWVKPINSFKILTHTQNHAELQRYLSCVMGVPYCIRLSLKN